MDKALLEQVRDKLGADPRLAGCRISREGEEIHLARGDELFVRLIPAAAQGLWRMESFRNQERWEIIEFQGTLDECLEFLGAHPHYLFFE
ncbi:hypothetical protein [Geoalkalibacter sp.]|uniref:hypothetical protein n=1 Tax=Geoalkalibacter sp. TaxID=3041440 RepID=UPI00272E68DA|nr:hypothetical protein [Geoalkalibacter sp.]